MGKQTLFRPKKVFRVPAITSGNIERGQALTNASEKCCTWFNMILLDELAGTEHSLTTTALTCFHCAIHNSLFSHSLSTGVAFKNFANQCSKRSYAIMTNPDSGDFQHPIHVKNIINIQVDTESKVFFHRPSLR